MVIDSTVKDLYNLALKYKKDMSKYSDMNPYFIYMDLLWHLIENITIIPSAYLQPIYMAQQKQTYLTLKLTPPKALDWIEVNFTIEKIENEV